MAPMCVPASALRVYLLWRRYWSGDLHAWSMWRRWRSRGLGSMISRGNDNTICRQQTAASEHFYPISER